MNSVKPYLTSPWRYTVNHDPVVGGYVIYVREADIAGREESDAEDVLGIVYGEADARLATAAPELFKACYRALDVLQGMGKALETQKLLAAAIAQAEGPA